MANAAAENGWLERAEAIRAAKRVYQQKLRDLNAQMADARREFEDACVAASEHLHK